MAKNKFGAAVAQCYGSAVNSKTAAPQHGSTSDKVIQPK